MEILIYGLGKFADKIEKIIKKEHTIVGYTDSFATIQSFHNKKFYQLDMIKEVKFDYILIALQERKVAWEIKQLLINDYGINERKVIPFSIYAKNEIVENMMVVKNDVDGIILGNSHAYHGYQIDYLDGRFVNLSCPSQDIYYNYKVFEKYCGNVTKNLNYLVFDLYDYNIFNSDISLTKWLFIYIYEGGVKCKGNFDRNIHYSKSFEEELFKTYYMITELSQEDAKSMDLIFGNYVNPILMEKINNTANNNWNIIKKDASLPVNKFLEDIVLKRFDDTIEENIEIIENLIQLVRDKSPDCKIIFTLLPRYITMEKVLSKFMKAWMESFEDIVLKLQKKYGVYFINYKNRLDISENNYFFGDICHLNTIGGRCITSILNEDLKKIKDSTCNKDWIITLSNEKENL